MRYNYKEIGERIKRIRKEHKLSHQDCLRKLQISMNRRRLSEIEKGNDMYFSFDFLLKFSEYFNCDIGYILCEYDETTQEKHQICSATGLSEQAIDNLKIYKKYPDIIDFIDTIIANPNIFTNLTHYANGYFDSLRRCKELKEKYPQHCIETPHIHLPTKPGKFTIDEKHEAEERELREIYKNEVDNVQPLQLYKLQNFFMAFIRDYGEELLKDGVKNG